MAFDDEFVDVGGVERVEGLQGEVIDLCRARHSSTYTDPGTMPTSVVVDDCELMKTQRRGLHGIGIVAGR